MKNYVVPLLLLICLIVGTTYVLFNTPLIINMVMPELFEKYVPNVELVQFTCFRQKSELPDKLMMRDVFMTVKQGGRSYDIEAKQITIHNLFEFLKEHKALRLSASGMLIRTKNAEAQGMKVRAGVVFNKGVFHFSEGVIFLGRLQVGPYVFDKITSRFRMTPAHIEIFEIESDGYGGTFQGYATFDYNPAFNYVLWLEMKDITASAVDRPYPEFFAGIKGVFDGSVRIVGAEQVDIFTIILHGAPGIGISPKMFLKVPSAFDEQEKAELKRLNKAGVLLKASQSTLHIQNIRASKIMFAFDIKQADTSVLVKGRFPLMWSGGPDAFLFPVKKP